MILDADDPTTPQDLVAHYRAVKARLAARQAPRPAPVSQALPPLVQAPQAPAQALGAKRKRAPRKSRAKPRAPLPAVVLVRANGDPPPPPAEPSRPHARVRKIVEPILRARETPWDDVVSPSRRHELIATRIVVYVALHNAGFSMKQIGRFCERDHTTILHYLRKWAGYKSKPRKVDPYRVTFKKKETKP